MSKLLTFFGVDIPKARRIYAQNGNSVKGLLYTFYRQSFLKDGTLIGTDAHGNKYFQNKEFSIGRSRWVIYSPKFGMDFDGSMVAPEWFGWLHYKTDELPTAPSMATPKYTDAVTPHDYMMTNTSEAYMPYSTAKPKVQAWTPPKAAA